MDPQQTLVGVQDAMTARRVFGEPVSVDGVTVIPVASIRGGGGGGGRSEEGGAGFALNARPTGVFIVRDGDARWRPAIDVNRAILGGQLVAITALLTGSALLRTWLVRRHSST